MKNKVKLFELNNGTEINVRLLEVGDQTALQDGFMRLSDKSKRLRFLSNPQKLSNKELNYLTNIDNENHLAVCAFIVVNDVSVGVGVARYIKLAKNSKKAEIAITIVDEFQGMGIGKILINEIIGYAQQNGITCFEANAFYLNNVILKIIHNYNYKITSAEEGVLNIEIGL